MNTQKKKRPQNTGRVLIWLLHYMSRYKLQAILVIACMIISAVCSVRSTYYLKPAINDHIIPLIGQRDPDLTGFLHNLLCMAILYLCAVAAAFLESRIMIYISNQVMYRIRTDMFYRMQRLPLSYFDEHNIGQIMSYYTNDVDSLSNMLRQSFPKIVEGGMTCISTLVTIFMVNYKLAFIVVLCELFMICILRILVKKNITHFAGQQQELSHLNAYAEEMIDGRSVVKAFGREKDVIERFRSVNERLFHSSSKADFYANSIFCVTNGIFNIGFTIIAVTGGLMSMHGLADIGTTGTFLLYYRNMYNPLTNISKQFNNLLGALAGAERIFQFIDTPEEPDEGKTELVNVILQSDGSLKETSRYTGHFAFKDCTADKKSSLKLFEGRLQFEHVDFGYKDSQLVLHDFNLSIEPGQKVAIVGTTGAGKTTIINLLSRFYEIQAGRILCDGIDIKTVKKECLRNMIVMVLQDTQLFTGSVEDNIRYGRFDASSADIMAAAELAHADSFIRKLPEEYDTILTHGGDFLSQGQKQLLAIARAAVSHAPILILDEATSSIDTRTEALIDKGFDSLMKDRTVLVIAHRLSTIKDADLINVLDHGHIAEKGTHTDLLKQNGIYHDLCASLAGSEQQ